jgi:hypothetical protein
MEWKLLYISLTGLPPVGELIGFAPDHVLCFLFLFRLSSQGHFYP